MPVIRSLCLAILMLGDLVLAVTLDVSITHRELLAVLKRNGIAGNQMRTVPGAKTLGRNHVARLDGVFAPAQTVKNVRGTALEGPIHSFPVRVFNVEIEIDMRIHEFHFGNGSGKRDGLAVVKFNAESVMCHYGRGYEECRRKCDGREEGASHEFLQERILRQVICQRLFGVKPAAAAAKRECRSFGFGGSERAGAGVRRAAPGPFAAAKGAKEI